MQEELIKAFPSLAEKELSDEYIEEHYDLRWDIPEIPLIRAVPLYMLWCVDHEAEEDKLVFDNTISALNEYSREKENGSGSQGFKFSCNEIQIKAIILFLQWCKADLMLDYDPYLSRAIKNWQAISNSDL